MFNDIVKTSKMIKNMIKMTIIAVSAIVVSVTGSQAQKATLQVATEGAFAPWSFIKPNGQLAGFDLDLVHDLCERVKVKCEVSAHEFTSLIPGLNAHKYDMVIDAINVTEERLKVAAFTRPYAVENYSFAIMGDGDIKDMPDNGVEIDLDKNHAAFEKAQKDLLVAFKGKTLAAQSATTNLDFIQKYFSNAATIRQYKSTELHDLDLQAGRVDAIFSSISGLIATSKQSGFEQFKIVGPVFSGDELGRGTAMVFRKDDNDLRKKFDDAITAAIVDGTIKRLSIQWFGVDISPKL